MRQKTSIGGCGIKEVERGGGIKEVRGITVSVGNGACAVVSIGNSTCVDVGINLVVVVNVSIVLCVGAGVSGVIRRCRGIIFVICIHSFCTLVCLLASVSSRVVR